MPINCVRNSIIDQDNCDEEDEEIWNQIVEHISENEANISSERIKKHDSNELTPVWKWISNENIKASTPKSMQNLQIASCESRCLKIQNMFDEYTHESDPFFFDEIKRFIQNESKDIHSVDHITCDRAKVIKKTESRKSYFFFLI